ncbi:hypothetical protein K7X08_004120 [Anisodus acutangulus]|uniref:Uncharacterized protein n=1 Tax=Anisodus acutangulus TaxID=402998 RepID=A0A9Q1MGN5_9SOLA|nr:hypothetical protein K7X08_004120 [Anisodus acutangulus]
MLGCRGAGIKQKTTTSHSLSIYWLAPFHICNLFELLLEASNSVTVELEFGWRVVGSIIGLFAAALGSVGGVGGGGIFVPMLTLVIGFDPKTSTAISKCMVTGAAGATDYYNIKQRHPTMDMPVIDYNPALLFQPMLLLGISMGVVLNVLFAEWMVTILLIALFIVASTKAFLKGVMTWKRETFKEAAGRLASGGAGGEEIAYKLLPEGSKNGYNRTYCSLGPYPGSAYIQELYINLFSGIVDLKPLAGPCCCRSFCISSSSLVQGIKGDHVKRGCSNKLGSASVNSLLFLRHFGWCSWWTAWSWWRIHFGTIASRTRHSSPGIKCYCYLCNDIFLLHVCDTILPTKTLSNTIRWGWHIRHDRKDRARAVYRVQ